MGRQVWRETAGEYQADSDISESPIAIYFIRLYLKLKSALCE